MNLADQSRVRGRLVLITGASGGRRICETHGHRRCKVGSDLFKKNKEKLDDLVQDFRASDCDDIEISTHKVDLANVEEIHKLLQDVQQAHRQPVEILVANAGYGKKIVDIEDIDLEDFEYAHKVNVRAPYLLVKGVVGDMKKRQWGRIIFISSIAPYGGGINGVHLKEALRAWRRTWLRDWQSTISQYDVAPAMIGDTGILFNPIWIPEVIRCIPLGRLGKPEGLTEAVKMFAKTGYVTGQSIIAGGWLR